VSIPPSSGSANGRADPALLVLPMCAAKDDKEPKLEPFPQPSDVTNQQSAPAAIEPPQRRKSEPLSEEELQKSKSSYLLDR
jgi:hypothetical protein